jgi:hypothetical protein
MEDLSSPSVALKAAKNWVFVGITGLFRIVTGLRVGAATALGDCARRIPEEAEVFYSRGECDKMEPTRN